MKKKHSGGTRKGAGRKPKYTEKCISIAFKVPISAEVAVRELVKNYLEQYLITKQNENQ